MVRGKSLDKFQINDEKYINNKLFIDLLVTVKCNFGCWYCINQTVSGRKDHLSEVVVDFVSDEVFQRVIDFIDLQGRQRLQFNFFGGEPTLHPKLKDMVRTIRERYDGRVEILTTSNLSRPIEYWHDWQGAKVVASFHSEWVDDIDEWFEKAIYLSEKGCLEHVIVMIQKNNFELVKEINRKYRDKVFLRFGDIYQIRDSFEFREFEKENPEIIERLNGVRGLLAESTDVPDVDIQVLLKDGTDDSENYMHYDSFAGMVCCSGYIIYPDGGVIYCWNHPKPFMNVLDRCEKLNNWHLCMSKSCGCGLIFMKCSMSYYLKNINNGRIG